MFLSCFVIVLVFEVFCPFLMNTWLSKEGAEGAAPKKKARRVKVNEDPLLEQLVEGMDLDPCASDDNSKHKMHEKAALLENPEAEWDELEAVATWNGVSSSKVWRIEDMSQRWIPLRSLILAKVFSLEPWKKMKSSVGAEFIMPDKSKKYARVAGVWVELLLNSVGPVGRKYVVNKDMSEE